MHAGFGGIFGVFYVFQPSKILKIFFARAFGARESLLYLFGWGRAQKQRIRESVRLALCSFGTFLAGGTRENNAFVSLFVWRHVLFDIPRLF